MYNGAVKHNGTDSGPHLVCSDGYDRLAASITRRCYTTEDDGWRAASAVEAL